MTNIYNFEKSMKIRWVKQIFISSGKSWLDLLLNDINLTSLSSLGDHWCLSIMQNLNPFWKTVLQYFNEFCQLVKPKTNLDISCTSLWLNKQLGTENIYFIDWFKKGVHVIGDIIKQDGNILQFDEIKTMFGFRPNYLNYLTVRSLVRKFFEKNQISNRFYFCRPHMPLHIRVLLGSQAGSKNIYCVLQQTEGNIFNNELKWNQNLDCPDIPWRLIYKTCFYSVSDNNYVWFQYRIIHRILGVQDNLYKMRISDTDICRLCGEQKETIIHLFSECSKSTTLWQNLISWINSAISMKIDLNKVDEILGYAKVDGKFWPLNLILLVTRHYIFTCARDDQRLNIYHLQNLIKKIYIEQETLSKINSKSDSFEKNWSIWKNIFVNI